MKQKTTKKNVTKTLSGSKINLSPNVEEKIKIYCYLSGKEDISQVSNEILGRELDRIFSSLKDDFISIQSKLKEDPKEESNEESNE